MFPTVLACHIVVSSRPERWGLSLVVKSLETIQENENFLRSHEGDQA